MKNNKEVEKCAEDFIDVEIKPPNSSVFFMCSKSCVAGFRLAESLSQSVPAQQVKEVQFEEHICPLCNEKIEPLAGNPGRWPVYLPYMAEPGKGNYFHIDCIMKRLKVEAGITIEQAKAQAEKKLGTADTYFTLYETATIYASSAVQTAIEKERERILAALPGLYISVQDEILMQCERTDCDDRQTDIINDFVIETLRLKLQSIIANK